MELKQLACPNCGTALHQHNPNSRTIVCPSCSSHVGVGIAQPELLQKGGKIRKAPKPIALGDRARIQNVEYVVLGRVEYKGWDQNDKSDTWRWTEWLLGAEDGRMFWLAYDDEAGFVLFQKRRIYHPFNPFSSSQITVDKAGKKHAVVKERYPAQIEGAEGELTWKAQTGDQQYTLDIKGNGRSYSLALANDEIEFYEGISLKEEEIAQAFNNKKWLNQSRRTRDRRFVLGFAGIGSITFALLALVLAVILGQSGKKVTTENVTLSASNPTVTIPLEVKSTRPVRINMKMLSVLPTNTYAEVDVTVTDPTGEEYDVFSKEFWHETGTDEDGTWNEADYNDAGTFIPLQKGDHQITLAFGENNANLNDMPLEVAVYRDHFVTGWLYGYGVLFGIVGILLFGASAPKTAGAFLSSLAEMADD